MYLPCLLKSASPAWLTASTTNSWKHNHNQLWTVNQNFVRRQVHMVWEINLYNISNGKDSLKRYLAHRSWRFNWATPLQTSNIYNFSQTTEWILMYLNRQQVLDILYEVSVFGSVNKDILASWFPETFVFLVFCNHCTNLTKCTRSTYSMSKFVFLWAELSPKMTLDWLTHFQLLSNF